MTQPRLLALIASAFVLYVVASAGAAGVRFDAGALALAAVALWGALVPLWLRRGEPDGAPAQVGTLSALLGMSLLAWLAFDVHALVGEIVCALALPMAGVLALSLSLSAPDVPPKIARHVQSQLPVRVLALVAAGLGFVAALPPFDLFGRPLIAPPFFARIPILFALSCAVLATAVRILRRRLGSPVHALSANLWPALSSSVALVLLAAMLVAGWLGFAAAPALQVGLALAALIFLLGHVWLVSKRRALVASAWARELFAVAFALGLVSATYVLLDPVWPRDVLARAALLGASLVAFELVRVLLRRLARFLFAPHRGALLSSVELIRREVAGSPSYPELAGRVLRPLRRATSSPEAAPLFYAFHPAREVRLDAAGQPRVSERPLHPAIVAKLHENGGSPIVPHDLQGRLVRRPELRELVWALDELDALCVLPLAVEGELDGAIVLPHGERRDPLTLEELMALEDLARFVAPLASVFLMSERENRRAADALLQGKELRARVDDLEDELAHARAQVNLLKAGRSGAHSSREPIQYSASMRELLARLESAASHDVPLLLVSEPGVPLAPLGEHIHRASGRRDAPFLVGDCAELEPERAMQALLGVANPGASRPGWLELASEGTLLLSDVAALGLEVQRVLAEAIGERRAQAVGASASYPVTARVVATLRRPLSELVSVGAIGPELARWLEPTTYHVPPLRERREDLESLVLIAMDRAARVLGRDVPGIDPDALSALVQHDWPGNLVELESVVERAVTTCKGARVGLEDLPALPARTALAGSFTDQEREILRLALERAGGNKTRAARALGLKRTTLIDKLRRHGLEAPGPRGTEH